MKRKLCGHYCLYYALFRSGNISMSAIVHRFSSDKRQNDYAVKRFTEKHFPLSQSKYHTYVNKQGVKAQHKDQ